MTTAPRPYRFTVQEFDQMGKAGIFDEDDRVELINGEIIEMTPIGPRHADYTGRLHNQPWHPTGAYVWAQNPIQIDDDGQPQPDLALLRRRPRPNTLPRAADVLLVIEVADDSLQHDRQVKAALYAGAGIPEYWLLNARAKSPTLTVYRNPGPDGYQDVRLVHRGEPLAPQAFPDFALDTDDLLG